MNRGRSNITNREEEQYHSLSNLCILHIIVTNSFGSFMKNEKEYFLSNGSNMTFLHFQFMSTFCMNSIPFTSILFCGQLGKIELDAVSLANTVSTLIAIGLVAPAVHTFM